MAFPGSSTIPLSACIAGGDEEQSALVTECALDVVFGLNISKESEMPRIPDNIDEDGVYAVVPDLAAALMEAAEELPVAEDAPEPVNFLIQQGYLNAPRSDPEDPPTDDFGESDSDDDEMEPAMKRPKIVNEGNLPTLGLADDTSSEFTFGSVLEAYEPAGLSKR